MARPHRHPHSVTRGLLCAGRGLQPGPSLMVWLCRAPHGRPLSTRCATRGWRHNDPAQDPCRKASQQQAAQTARGEQGPALGRLWDPKGARVSLQRTHNSRP